VIDLGQPLQRRAGLDQHALAKEPAAGGDLHGWRGQAKRAGTGDDQHRRRT
jgi:hypothetical protein